MTVFPCVTFKTPFVRKAMGNHLMNSTSLEKLRALSLVSAMFENEYAKQFSMTMLRPVLYLIHMLCCVGRAVEVDGAQIPFASWRVCHLLRWLDSPILAPQTRWHRPQWKPPSVAVVVTAGAKEGNFDFRRWRFSFRDSIHADSNEAVPL